MVWLENPIKESDNGEVRFVNSVDKKELVLKRKSSSPEYQAWINKNEGAIETTYDLEYQPLISIVVPVYNVEDEI